METGICRLECGVEGKGSGICGDEGNNFAAVGHVAHTAAYLTVGNIYEAEVGVL